MTLINGRIEDKKIYIKIVNLIKDIQRDPFSGLGKPEALKYDLSGLWSRRITQEHRLVYSVSDEEIVIISCKFHY
ncbi:Txe/YoeB family addiction module toxin [Okeania sp. SIO2B3]|uniref:Txe/YoeB family addiction module toxin n=1 Tax=Okeania sp. SIO2B3 TaxID=2607784 RepID=UPI0013C1877A|nr:Txe/YoeB family addiction module toxin [Okeania sp. SIO2B3]NET41662.1 Txe/YoeB family addiction module toxin [Okeania sp. SIO2B3]